MFNVGSVGGNVEGEDGVSDGNFDVSLVLSRSAFVRALLDAGPRMTSSSSSSLSLNTDCGVALWFDVDEGHERGWFDVSVDELFVLS